MNTLRFTKMHGLGNDFVVIDATRQTVELDAESIRRIADRHRGIGCDQLLLVEPPHDSTRATFRYRIFNADGGEVEHCGNGARCFAAFVYREGLTDERCIRVETLSGLLELNVQELRGEHAIVEVEMGVPRFEPDALAFDDRHPDVSSGIEGRFRLALGDDESVEFDVVSLGNPHAVIRVASVDHAPVVTLGASVQAHPAFARGVNVGFVERIDRSRLRLRVFERGSGETQACGTGATAAMVAMRRRGCVDARCEVTLTGGTLVLHWNEDGVPARMLGSASFVFRGETQLLMDDESDIYPTSATTGVDARPAEAAAASVQRAGQ